MSSSKACFKCLLIDFTLPEIGNQQTDEELDGWEQLEEIWETSSSCVGYIISLGEVLDGEDLMKSEESSYQGCNQHLTEFCLVLCPVTPF